MPGDAFSVLLILGGDVVGRAIAQLAGSGVAPVAFSFGTAQLSQHDIGPFSLCLDLSANPCSLQLGWVAYSITALVSAVGENKLMPLDPDCRCKVIDGKSGYSRDNSSWILGRIVRDFDHWRDDSVRTKLDEVLKEKLAKMRKTEKNAKKPPMAGLIVSIYKPSTTIPAGTVKRDVVFWIGLPIIVLQLGISAIACGVYGEWGTLLITAAGIALSLATGLLPQWKNEKWACRDKAKHDYILTRGNGSQHVIVVRGNEHGFNLEDLASGQSNVMVATNLFTSIALLPRLKQKTWFLLAVGSIGILQNIYVAGAWRRPENFGIPLDFVEVFGKPSAMQTLQEVEEKYENVGRALLHEFFPGSITETEERQWAELERHHARWQRTERIQSARNSPI
ncbi:hypothetical protein EDB80DRAFT_881289 [Ilyonectria destructans]|nr:hypothetical protein EDB80DRAFT_881289 [Ilyonectria destructans]